MELSNNEKIKWIPFGLMASFLLVITIFWKIEKSVEQPIPTMAEVQGGEARQAGRPSAKKSKMEGKPAPDFSIPTIDGKSFTLSDYRGKIVFLNFWATWCPPCKEEMPSMQKLHKHLEGTDFVMLTVSIDEKPELIEPYMKELGLDFIVGLDPKSEIANMYGLTGVPETFLISRSGIVLHHMIGPGDWFNKDLVSALEGIVRSKNDLRPKNELQEKNAPADGIEKP